MDTLLQLLMNDMKPALGVTEPGAIAFAAAKARSYLSGAVKRVHVVLNSGMYKNAYTCGIPHSSHVGNVYAAALGVIAGKAELGLESLSCVEPADNAAAEELVQKGCVTVEVGEITSHISIQAAVETSEGTCTVVIDDSHTNVVQVIVNGTCVLAGEKASSGHVEAEETALIHQYTLAELYDFVQQVPIEKIQPLQRAYDMNLELFREGQKNERTVFLQHLWQVNGNRLISDDEAATAQLLCGGAIEARVLGLDKPAMSITGSGSHGIICTLPLYAVYKIEGLSQETLLRATALSYLVTMYIKEYSGKLSAFCGCAIAAGTGMACALAYMKGGDLSCLHRVVNNMAAGITGMICDGGNHGCTMKGIVAVDAAFRAVQFAVHGVSIENVHGIIGNSPEDTFRYMGWIASPGMEGTEKSIIDILAEKSRQQLCP